MKIKFPLISTGLIVLVFCLLFSSCSGPSIPEYLRFKIGEIQRVDKKWQIKGQAFYMNTNSFGGNVKACDVDVYINEVLATHISQTVSVNIEANKEFAIPVTCIIDTKKIRKENKGFLKGVVRGLLGEKVNLRYEGHFVTDLMGVGIKIPFEFEEKVSFGMNSDH